METDRTNDGIRPRVTVRPFSGDDLAFLSRLISDQQATGFLSGDQRWGTDRITAEADHALRYISVDETGAARWFIGWQANEPVGALIAHRAGADLEIDYWVSADHAGRDIDTALLQKAQQILPDLFGCSTLVTSAKRDDDRARRLAQCGFVPHPSDSGSDYYKWDATPEGT